MKNNSYTIFRFNPVFSVYYPRPDSAPDPGGAGRCPRRNALGTSSSLELNPVRKGMNLCETKHLLSQA
jgi:hypothetical protein